MAGGDRCAYMMPAHWALLHRRLVLEQSRPLVVCEGARVLPTQSTGQDASDRSELCTLEVCGFVRQSHLSAGQIAYLSGSGDYEIAYITRHVGIEAEARGADGQGKALGRAPRKHSLCLGGAVSTWGLVCVHRSWR